jgi:hypothetical protein
MLSDNEARSSEENMGNLNYMAEIGMTAGGEPCQLAEIPIHISLALCLSTAESAALSRMVS